MLMIKKTDRVRQDLHRNGSRRVLSGKINELIELNEEQETQREYGNQAMKYLMWRASANYFEFLYILEVFLQWLRNSGIETESTEDLFSWINKFNLDYFWNEDEWIIERVVDKATESVINSNLIKTELDNLEKDYQLCLDDFLGVKNISTNSDIQFFYHQSLQKIARLLENIGKKNWISRPFANLKWILDHLMTKDSLKEIEKNLKFIQANIHHDSDEWNKITFTEKEYIYRRLEINKLIYLLWN